MARRNGFSRIDRVAATVKKALAAPLSLIVRGDSAVLATITEVEIAPDLRTATVFLSIYGISDRENCVRMINTHAAELQSALAGALRTKRIPVLKFRLDDVLERSDRIARLLRPGSPP